MVLHNVGEETYTEWSAMDQLRNGQCLWLSAGLTQALRQSVPAISIRAQLYLAQ
jgi:hypothetical protein